MEFNFDLLKKHPYITGVTVIVGGIVVFYLISSGSGSSSASTSSSGGNYPSQGDVQLAQINAGYQTQSDQTNAQLQAAQLSAQIQAQQTAASVQVNDTNTAAQLATALAQVSASVQENNTNVQGATAQQANQLVYAENIQQMQDAVLESQINSGVLENANNNATALAGTEATLNSQVQVAQLQAGIASQGLTEAGNLAMQQQSDFEKNVTTIIPLAGQQKNSALDATDQTGLFATILANGNSGVASTATGASATAAVSGNNANASNVASISSGLAKLGSAVASGLFG